MSGLARRITTTTTTTSSAASSRFIGDDGDDGVVLTERIGSDEGGGTMVFRGGGAAARLPIRSQRYESIGTADEGDTEDLMEPDMSDTSHMKFVDGRCSCCPYGYHVDLDFLQYLDSVNNGDSLNSLNRIHHNKAQLRKSMESYQQELARRGGAAVPPGSHHPPNSGALLLPPGAEQQSREHFMSTLEKENRSATRVLDDIDKTIEGHLSTLDHGASIPRRVLTDGTNRTSDVKYDKTYTETIELRKLHHHQQQHQQQQRNREFDSGSSPSISSGPSSPTFPSGVEPSAPCGVTTGRAGPEMTTVSHHHTTSVSFPPPKKQNRLLELEQQLLEIRPIPPTDQFQRTYINSAEFASSMAGLLPSDLEQDRDTPTNEDRVNGVGRPGRTPSPSPEMTRISAATLQAIREQMAASLQRMHELEEQVKAIPVLQVRNSVLKEEKRMLELQLQSRADRMRTIGVGDYSVDESDFDERSELSYLRSLHSGGVDEDRLRLTGLRREGEGTDEDGLFRSTTTVSLGYGMDGDLIPVRVHEKELKTEENTEIREKEIKTIFLGGGGDVLTTDLSGVDRQQRTGRLAGKVVKKDVRSIGVGEGNVFDATGGVEVHQKELRTVYIGGDTGKDSKATRNVGILCKPAMRDVGMVHMTDSERPMQRTIAVGVGEIGVGDGWGGGGGGGGSGGEGYYVSEDGVEGGGASQTMNTAMSQMTISAYQTRFGGLRNEQLRSMLDEMLKRTVHTVAIQCSFSTEDKSVDASRVGYDMVDVACSDDVIDVDVVPIRVMKSVAIDNRPSLFHRSCGTDYVYKIDMATNTQTQGIRAHRATNTEATVTFPAATNTESPVVVSQAAETERAVFYAMEQLHNIGTNTNIQQFANVGFNTDLIGDVMPLVIKPDQKDSSVNTATSSVRVWDKTTNTTPSQRMEKAVNTSAVPHFDRGINTEKVRVSIASVNTEKGVYVSRGTDCNIIQPEKKSSEGVVQSTSEISRSTRFTGPEPVKQTERQEVRSSTSHQQEVVPRIERGADDERSEFEEEVTTGSSGGRMTTTRVVKTVTRGGGGGRSEAFVDLPVTADLGFRGSGLEQSGSSSGRTVTTTIGRPALEEGLSSGGGRSSSTRTVTTTSRVGGGRSDLLRDFPEVESGFQSSGSEQITETEGGGSRRIVTTRTERPEEGIGFGSSGGRSSTSRTVTMTSGGGRTDLLGDLAVAGELGFQGLGNEQITETEGGSSRRTITTRTERPEDAIGFGSVGGRGLTTRTVTTVTRGGRSGISADFPSGELGYHTTGREEIGGLEGSSSSRRAITSRMRRAELGDEIGAGSSGGRTMTTRTVRTITGGGGGVGRVDVSEEFPSGEVGFQDDGELDVAGGSSQGGISTRTITKTFKAGGVPQLDSFGNLDLMSSSDAGSSSSLRRTIIAGDESQLLTKMGDEFSRGLQSGGGHGGYSSSRTVIKRVSGDPDDPDAWHEETWVSGGSGDEATSGQITGFSSGQTEVVEFPEQRSTLGGETRTEHHHHVTGQSSSSSSSSFSSGVTTEEPLKSIMKTTTTTRSSGVQPSNAGRKGISFSETITSKYEASEELELACKLYGHWIEDSTHVSTQQLNSSLASMQKEWFKVSSHKASSSDHVETYLKMIQNVSWDLRKKIVNMEDANGNTALHYAVSNGNLDVVNLLLETDDCDANHQNKTGCTAVMMAALANVKTEQHQDVIRRLFQMGDVNIQAPSGENVELAGQTALMLAVSHGRLDMVKLLLDCGANVNLQDDDGSTALMVAAEHGHVDITRLLLSHADCDAYIADKEGSTATSIAKDEGRQSIVTLLNAHLNSKPRTQSTSSSSQHKARKTVTRITLSSPTEMN